MELVRRPSFDRDLSERYAYLRDRSPRAAEAFLQRIDQALDGLLVFPRTGRMRHDLRRGVRVCIVTRIRYVIVYRIARDTIILLRALYGGRDLRAALRKD